MYAANPMDLRRAIGEYVTQGRELLEKLRSPEGPTASPVDLHILRVQLFLLDCQAANMERLRERTPTSEVAKVQRKKSSSPSND
jgi:hypothetical protein